MKILSTKIKKHKRLLWELLLLWCWWWSIYVIFVTFDKRLAFSIRVLKL